MVPNHTSELRAWFQEALVGGPGSRARDRYHFRNGRGEHGELPPNNWTSEFGGLAWTRVTEPDGEPGQWYLHLFSPQQPDLNWDHPDVRADFEHTLRFWFDRGVDGFASTRTTSSGRSVAGPAAGPLRIRRAPHWDREALHDIYRSWRRIADSYDPPRVFVAEAWVESPQRLVRYVRSDELHTAFNFDFLASPWLPGAMKDMIDATLDAHASVAAPSTWVLSNHDVARHVSRYARPQREGSSASSTISWTVPRTSPSAPGVPVLRSCRCSHCPAARTSIWARSSGCRRLKTSPTMFCWTRCSSDPG